MVQLKITILLDRERQISYTTVYTTNISRQNPAHAILFVCSSKQTQNKFPQTKVKAAKIQ